MRGGFDWRLECESKRRVTIEQRFHIEAISAKLIFGVANLRLVENSLLVLVMVRRLLLRKRRRIVETPVDERVRL